MPPRENQEMTAAQARGCTNGGSNQLAPDREAAMASSGERRVCDAPHRQKRPRRRPAPPRPLIRSVNSIPSGIRDPPLLCSSSRCLIWWCSLSPRTGDDRPNADEPGGAPVGASSGLPLMTKDDEAAYGNLKQVTSVSPIPHIPKLS
jgi:hypothetical protein